MSAIETKNHKHDTIKKRGAYKAHRKAIFLREFAKRGMIIYSCAKAGISRSAVDDWRKNDPRFAQAFEETEMLLIEGLETVVHQRAMNGSDRLLMFLLKCRRPEKYHDRHNSESTLPVASDFGKLIVEGKEA